MTLFSWFAKKGKNTSTKVDMSPCNSFKRATIDTQKEQDIIPSLNVLNENNMWPIAHVHQKTCLTSKIKKITKKTDEFSLNSELIKPSL